MALPLVTEISQEALDYAESLRLPGGTMQLKVPQADALFSIHKYGGLIGVLGVGVGKTLIAWLAGRAAEAQTVVILMRPPDVKSYNVEIEKYKKHFDPGSCTIHVIPYSKLSDPRFGEILDEISPDLIVADEAQTLMGDSTRAKRFWRYREEHPETTLVAMSGTMIKGSVANAAELAEFALGVRSPLPHRGPHLETWQHVLDPAGMGSPDEMSWFHERVVRPMGVDPNEFSRQEAARLAAGRRFVQSQGVVFTPSASTDLPLEIHKIAVPMPESLQDFIDEVKKNRVTPDGEDVIWTDMQAANVSRMIASGFYTRWKWEDVPGGRDEEWLARRSAWGRSLASELKNNSRKGYDSPKLIGDYVLAEAILDKKMVERSTLHFNRWAWGEVEHRMVPETVPVWLNTFLVDYALEAYKDQPVIFWYSHQAMEQEFARRGVPVYGASTFLDGPARQVAASIQVHGTGRNLQDWDHAVVLEHPTDGVAWEQLLGRLHRQGQTRPVRFDLLISHETIKSAIRSAIENAKFIQSMQMTPQRLLTATWV
mgnify:CR=1 FL=1